MIRKLMLSNIYFNVEETFKVEEEASRPPTKEASAARNTPTATHKSSSPLSLDMLN